jgi:hypothetical protein
MHPCHRVGDTIKFGQSSRMYIFGGPEELMPAVGLSAAQKKQLAVLEAAKRQKEVDEEKARAQMVAALNGNGASWGMLGVRDIPRQWGMPGAAACL